MMIHDGPDLDTKFDIRPQEKSKGRTDSNPCKVQHAKALHLEIQTPVEQEKTIHDGMKVFQAWGPHIKKFAMAFDVEEGKLVVYSC